MNAAESMTHAERIDRAAKDLFIAIRYGGTMDEVSKALADGAPVSGINHQNRGLRMTPLMIAASLSNHEACSALIEAGADLHEEDDEGWEAASYAARQANVETLKAFIDASPLTQAKCTTLLHHACNNGNVENTVFLISLGACARAKTDGHDAMMHAAIFGNFECAIAVLVAGGDPSAKNPEGLTALEICRAEGNDFAANKLEAAIYAFEQSREIAACAPRAAGGATRRSRL